MSTTRDLARLHRFVFVLLGLVVLLLFTLLRLLPIIILPVLDAQEALSFGVADTTTNVAFYVAAIAGHYLHGGITSRDTPG